MTSSEGRPIEVAIASITQAWAAQGHEDTWLHLHCPEDAHDPVADAASRADEAAEQEHLDARTMALTPCPGGFALQVGPAFEESTIVVWVRHFVAALEDRDVTGRLSGADNVWPSEVLSAALAPVPTLFAWFAPSTLSASPQRGHPATEGLRRIVDETLGWALSEPGTITLTQDALSLRVGPDGLGHNLTRTLASGRGAGVDVVDEAQHSARHASLIPGDAIFQVVGGTGDAVTELRNLAVRLSPMLRLAVIRVAQRWVLGMHELDSVHPLPDLQEHHVRRVPHLMDRYVPDAHGVQVVGDAHLAAAGDLSRWSITDLGYGKHLVEAPDRTRWYGSGQPAPDVLAQGRSDWAGALLTTEVAYRH